MVEEKASNALATAGVHSQLRVAVEPLPEVEMLVIHVADSIPEETAESGNASPEHGGGNRAVESTDEPAAAEARTPSSMSSRIEDESECEEDKKRMPGASIKSAKPTDSPRMMNTNAMHQRPDGLGTTKVPQSANKPSATSNSSAPTPAPGTQPAELIRMPAFFTLAFFRVYFSKFAGQHGSAHVLGHRKPLHLFFTFIGAMFGIGLLGFLHYNIFMEIDYQANGVFLIGSFGASATLLYGAPTADFSQPRNVWGGHVVSALSGLIIGSIIPDSDTNYQTLRAAFAVAFAIVAMNVTHTVHPPGGATALIAVTPNAAIQHLHWLYLVLPVAVGAAIMILVAVVVNNCTQSRHYPKYWI